MDEIVKPIPGFDGYFATDTGRILSCRIRGTRRPGTRIGTVMRELNPTFFKGYPRVTLYRDRKGFFRIVHRLILEAFRGPCPDGMEGCHNDGNPSNAKLSNLRWDTRTANHADKWRHGTVLLGEKHPRTKLTNELARQVRERHSRGETTESLAKAFSTSRASIWRVVTGQTFASVMQSIAVSA